MHARVVDQAVNFGVVFDDFFNEGGNVGDLACVEDIVHCAVTEAISGLGKCLLGSSDDYDFLALRDEVLRDRFPNTTATCDQSAVEGESFGGRFERLCVLEMR